MPQRKTPAETQAWLRGAHKAIAAATSIAISSPSADCEVELHAQFDRLAMTVKSDGESEYMGFTYALAAMTWYAFSTSGQPGLLAVPHAEPKVRQLLALASARTTTLPEFIKAVSYPDDRQPVSVDYMLRACVQALRAEMDNWDEAMPRWAFLGTVSSLVTGGA